jgi:hypothetical protein
MSISRKAVEMKKKKNQENNKKNYPEAEDREDERKIELGAANRRFRGFICLIKKFLKRGIRK